MDKIGFALGHRTTSGQKDVVCAQLSSCLTSPVAFKRMNKNDKTDNLEWGMRPYLLKNKVV